MQINTSMSSGCGHPIDPLSNITAMYLKVHSNQLREAVCHLPFVARKWELRKGHELQNRAQTSSFWPQDVILGTPFPVSHPQPRPLTLQINTMEDKLTKSFEISCPYENFSFFPRITSSQTFSSDHDSNRSIFLKGKAC